MNVRPMSTEKQKRGFWKSVPAIVAGATSGIVFLIALRVVYYEMMELQPNMAPQIAYYFSPIILFVVLTVALPLEAILRHFTYTPQNSWQGFGVGAAYATLITWWAFPLHWPIFLVVNPIVLRWALGLTLRSKADRPQAAGG